MHISLCMPKAKNKFCLFGSIFDQVIQGPTCSALTVSEGVDGGGAPEPASLVLLSDV